MYYRLQVQWLFNDRPVNLIDYEVTSDGNIHYLHIPEVFMEDNGTFTIAAVNEAGKAVHSAHLTVVDQREGSPSTKATSGDSERYYTTVSVPVPPISQPPADTHESFSVFSPSVGEQLMLSQELQREAIKPDVIRPVELESVMIGQRDILERTS